LKTKSKKQVAAVIAVACYFQKENENNKISWNDNREVGWMNQPRKNWTKN